jgi:hypothetical protein
MNIVLVHHMDESHQCIRCDTVAPIYRLSADTMAPAYPYSSIEMKIWWMRPPYLESEELNIAYPDRIILLCNDPLLACLDVHLDKTAV